MKTSVLTKRLVESGETVLPFQEKEWVEQCKMNYKTLRPYAGGNVPLLAYTPCDLFITKKCAEKDYNAHLKEDARYYQVTTYFPLKKRKDETLEQFRQRTHGFPFSYRVYNVYPITDVEGLPKKELTIDKESKNIRKETAEIFIKRAINKLGIQIVEGGNNSYFNMDSNTITIPNITRFVSEGAYYANIFRAIILGTGTPKHLKRYKDNDTKDEDYSKEQLVAEMGVAALCNIFKVDVPKSTVNHVDNWLSKLEDDPAILMSASSQSQRAIDFLMK
jgi:antirestriction protein ArdC